MTSTRPRTPGPRRRIPSSSITTSTKRVDTSRRGSSRMPSSPTFARRSRRCDDRLRTHRHKKESVIRNYRLVHVVLAIVFFAALAAAPLGAQASSAPPAAGATSKPTVVLVHGAFADATGWQRLIPILQRDGYEVLAVQIPLASLAGD